MEDAIRNRDRRWLSPPLLSPGSRSCASLRPVSPRRDREPRRGDGTARPASPVSAAGPCATTRLADKTRKLRGRRLAQLRPVRQRSRVQGLRQRSDALGCRRSRAASQEGHGQASPPKPAHRDLRTMRACGRDAFLEASVGLPWKGADGIRVCVGEVVGDRHLAAVRHCGPRPRPWRLPFAVGLTTDRRSSAAV